MTQTRVNLNEFVHVTTNAVWRIAHCTSFAFLPNAGLKAWGNQRTAKLMRREIEIYWNKGYNPYIAVYYGGKMDELKVTSLGIGHGDATLLQWRTPEKQWICLIDGGESPERLIECLDQENVNEIDLLVLSHLDTDHIGGFMGLEKKKKIGAFWGPVLPAFERHLWLFGARGEQAIRRGGALEKALKEAAVDICYPLEGYTSVPLLNLGKYPFFLQQHA